MKFLPGIIKFNCLELWFWRFNYTVAIGIYNLYHFNIIESTQSISEQIPAVCANSFTKMMPTNRTTTQRTNHLHHQLETVFFFKKKKYNSHACRQCTPCDHVMRFWLIGSVEPINTAPSHWPPLIPSIVTSTKKERNGSKDIDSSNWYAILSTSKKQWLLEREPESSCTKQSSYELWDLSSAAWLSTVQETRLWENGGMEAWSATERIWSCR